MADKPTAAAMRAMEKLNPSRYHVEPLESEALIIDAEFRELVDLVRDLRSETSQFIGLTPRDYQAGAGAALLRRIDAALARIDGKSALP
jgi:hypothetical protein